MLYHSTLTSKGQVTIPQPIRVLLGIKSNDKVEFVKKSNTVYIKPAVSLDELAGSLHSNKKYSDKGADKAVAEYIAKEYEETQSRS